MEGEINLIEEAVDPDSTPVTSREMADYEDEWEGIKVDEDRRDESEVTEEIA